MPEDMFSDCKSIKSVSALFDGCKNLTNVPKNLFVGCKELKDYDRMFKSNAFL